MKNSTTKKVAPKQQRKKLTKKPLKTHKRTLTVSTKKRTNNNTIPQQQQQQQFNSPLYQKSTRKIVTELTSIEEAHQFIVKGGSGKKLVVTDFAASWCGPCITLKPQYKALSEKFPNVAFSQIDADEFTAPDIDDNFPEVTALPTVMFFVDGVHVDTVVGLNVPKLQANIEKYSV